MKHTPEPWFAGRTDMRSYLGDGTPVHYVYRGDAETAQTRIRIVPMPGSDADPTDDALRIVACVNACAGLDIAKVSALLDAVRAWANADRGQASHEAYGLVEIALYHTGNSIRAAKGGTCNP